MNKQVIAVICEYEIVSIGGKYDGIPLKNAVSVLCKPECSFSFT